ncbi:MAG: coproporphyrinogen III oxidase, partial [Cyclobacteriaceae bacterium]|nr:coproporphyrinogen III oxidase [Cyclobacteriaceae bacterium]
YSYAHVPWIKGLGQRKFTEEDLPKNEEKRVLYEVGRSMLEENGYREIGMDHFALANDSLYLSMQNGGLHRNFMGYTSQRTKVMIGLGVSAISDTSTAFAQNEKKIEDYMKRVNEGEIPVFRGHILTEEDIEIKEAILGLMCFGSTDIPAHYFTEISTRLKPLLDDGLITLEDQKVTITETGKPFLRNVCMGFDMRLWRRSPKEQMFSMSV